MTAGERLEYLFSRWGSLLERLARGPAGREASSGVKSIPEAATDSEEGLWETCLLCNGLGYRMPGQTDCPACFGSGQVHRLGLCPACGNDHTIRLQGRCVVCNGPFMYWPTRDEVFLNECGFYQHVECPMRAPESTK